MKKAGKFILLLVVSVIIAVLIMKLFCWCGALDEQAHRRKQQELYQAWSKIHPEIKLTEREFEVLWRAEMLPERKQKQNGDNGGALIMGAIGGALASQIMK